MKIKIKPHHFMDIIKLYGSGIEVFIPDLNMNHDFYKIANIIIQNPYTLLTLTTQADDICQPCIKYQQFCTDTIHHIPNFTSKDLYNKILDERIIQYFHLNQETYPAIDLCEIIYNASELIFQIWQEEDEAITKKRHHLFILGAKKYIQENSL